MGSRLSTQWQTKWIKIKKKKINKLQHKKKKCECKVYVKIKKESFYVTCSDLIWVEVIHGGVSSNWTGNVESNRSPLTEYFSTLKLVKI